MTGAAELAPVANDPVEFVARLRSAGIDVALSATIHYADALAVIDLQRPDEIYWAGRATLTSRHDDISVYDRVFASFYLGAAAELAPTIRIDREIVTGFDDESEDDSDDAPPSDPSDDTTSDIRFSRVERLRDRDFASCDATELAELWRAIATMRCSGPMRRSLRLSPSRSVTPSFDVRRTVSASLRTGGEITELKSRRRRRRPRRLVLLVDVSGSMESYARALLRFAHAVSTARRRVEVFALGTRLTRLTRELSGPDPDAALGRAAASVADWSGGTRLGESLGRFCDEWGQRGTARGATVVILSDGWDRGDPDEMTEAMARLARLAHRIVWVNPLRASPGYAPLARGMAAALPYCDRFVDGHSMRALDELVDVLGDDR